MSVPNLTNNLLQQQNIVLNQVPITHTIMTNVNNSVPVVNAIPHTNSNDQNDDIKTGIPMVDTIQGL